MPTYMPTLSIAAPPTSAQMVGALTYNEFVNILGNQSFKVNQIFLETLTTAQIRKPMLFDKYDSSGIKEFTVLTPKLDPYQKVAAMWFDTKGQDVILNGLSALQLDVLPGESVTMILHCDMASFANELDRISNNNFKREGNEIGEPKTFDDFNDVLR